MNPQDNKDEQVQAPADQPNLEAASEQVASAPEVGGAAPATEPPKPEEEPESVAEDVAPAAVEPPVPEPVEAVPETAVSDQPEEPVSAETPEVSVGSDSAAAQPVAKPKSSKSLVVLGLALVLLGVATLVAFVLI